MGITFGGNGLLYDTLPLKNQTAHLSLHTLTSNLGVFLGMSAGTAIVAIIGDNSISFLGCTLTAVPVVRIIQGILLCVLALYNCRLRKRLDIKRSSAPSGQ